MSTQQLIEKIRKIDAKKIGRAPFVVLPLKIWEEIEDRLEDLRIVDSSFLASKIAKARREKRQYSAVEVRKMV